MTQKTTPLADRAARTAERLEAYDRQDDGPIMEYLAATGTRATVAGNGTVTDAWIVIQPGSPCVEFHPWDGTIRVAHDGEDFTRAIFPDEAMRAVEAAEEILALTYNGLEIEV